MTILEKPKSIEEIDKQFVDRAYDNQGYIQDFGVMRPPILPTSEVKSSYPVSQAGLFSFFDEDGALRTVALKIAPEDHISGRVPNIAMPGHHLISKEFQHWVEESGYLAGLPLFGYVRPINTDNMSNGVVFSPQYSLSGPDYDGKHVQELSIRIPNLIIYLGEGAVYRAGIKSDLQTARFEINH